MKIIFIIVYLIIGFIWHLIVKYKRQLNWRRCRSSKRHDFDDYAEYFFITIGWPIRLLWLIIKSVYRFFDDMIWSILK